MAADVKFLKNAGVAADEIGLLEFFKKQTANESQLRTIDELIKQLGDDRFRVREKATRELKTMGLAARTALRQAKDHADSEVANRAKHSLDYIQNGSHGELLACAARVVSACKSAKAVEALLALLPNAADLAVEEDFIRAVKVLAVSDGKAHPALVQALTDKLPLRRAAAGEALAQTAFRRTTRRCACC